MSQLSTVELEQLLWASKEDHEFWNKCTEGLSKLEGLSGTGFDSRGVQIPYGTGPHNLAGYREIVAMLKPKSIFEIGFNLGYSAAAWLELTEASILTIDISDKEETLISARVMKERYGDRFEFRVEDSTKFKLERGKYDMAFIDGSHLEYEVTCDLRGCLDAGIKWIVMDDWLHQFGPGVQVSVAKFPSLELVKIWGNTALLKNN